MAEGVPQEAAEQLTRRIAASDAMTSARALFRRVQALEQILRLRRDHRLPPIPAAEPVERRPLPSVEDLVLRYWVPGVPAIFTDLVPRWPAFGRWSMRHLVERYGNVEVEACIGRSTVAHPDPDWKGLARTLPMRELVAMLEQDGATGDVYVIAKNAALRRADLRGLLDDIRLPAEYFGDTLDPTRMSLWLGGGGTHTPLHHDGDNAMFCQVVGRKRVRLAPPESVALLEQARGVYSHWDPRNEEELRSGPERLVEIELAPGEALFLPAGWWHQIDALEPSMSVSIQAFAWSNDYAWYRPGTVLAGRKPPPGSGTP